MFGQDIIDYRLLFQDHILLVAMWISLWGLTEIGLDYLAGNSKILRISLLLLLFILSAQAITNLEKTAEKQTHLHEKEEIHKILDALRNFHSIR